jgi:hypothetical protein
MAEYATPQQKQAIQDHFREGKSKWDWTFGLKNPEVPHPSMFQADPPVVGDEMLQMLAQRLMDLDPRTKSNISRIVQGPTTGAISQLKKDGVDPLDYTKSNLMGTYNRKGGDISINPGLKNWDVYETLAHEMAHASGHDEGGAQALDNRLRLLSRRRK